MRLLTNFMQRWWWLLLLQFLLTISFWLIGGTIVHLEMLAAIAISWDLMRGLSRSVLGLPITRKTLARTIWLSSVILPALVSISGFSIGCLLIRKLPLEILLTHCCISVVLPGLVTFILTGLPGRPSEGFWGKLRDGLFGALWGLSISGSSFLAIYLQPSAFPLHPAVKVGIAVAAVLTVVSFFSVENMVIQRANRISAQPSQPRVPSKPESMLGWAVWWKMELRWHLLFGSMILVGMMVASGISFGKLRQPGNGLYSQVGMFSFMVLLPMMSLGIGSLRGLRALPISRARLATLFALRPLIQSLVMSGIVILFSIVRPADSVPLTVILPIITLGSVTALVQALIMRDPKPWMPIMCISLGAPLIMGFQWWQIEHSSYVGLPLLIAAVVYPLAWFLTHRWIQRSSRLYRPKAWILRAISGGARS